MVGLGSLILLTIVFLPIVLTILIWKKKLWTSKIRWLVTLLIFGVFWIYPGIIIYSENTIGTTTESSMSPSSSSECKGTGDEGFIRNKMSEMNRDILELNKIGSRKYYVRYISWSSGTAIEGDQVLDYSNSPCND